MDWMTAARVGLNVAIALDQALNCLWFVDGDGWGFPDEMMSARACRLTLQDHPVGPKAERVINALFFWQRDQTGARNHCARAWHTEAQRKQQHRFYDQG